MHPSRLGRAKRGLAAAALALGVVLAIAAPALARSAYVTNSGAGTVSVVDLATNGVVATVHVGEKPVDVAISPDGLRAYVVEMKEEGTVSVIDTESNAVVGSPIPVGKNPDAIAVSPDGTRAYVSNSGDDTVSVIDTATDSVVGSPIAVGEGPAGIAISPDGTRAFVANSGEGTISTIDTATGTTVGIPLAVGTEPRRIAIGPRGGRAFVTNGGSSSVTAFNPANGSTVGAPVNVGPEPDGIAIEPSGRLAYEASHGDGTVTPIDTSLESPLSPPIGGFPGAGGIAIDPSGLRGLVTDSGGESTSILDTASNAAAGTIGVGSEPTGVAISPDQGPTASLWISPTRMRARQSLTFHSSTSTDPDSPIVNYAWEFGDGGHVEGAATTRFHRYRKPGTYLVTLTVTDAEGCSTSRVFTGQTVSCNGSLAAVASSEITVISARGPAVRLAGSQRQRLRGRISVFARCPREACVLRARGWVVTSFERHGVARRQSHRVGGARALMPTSGWNKLQPRVPRRTRRAILRALRQGGEAKATVRVVARNLDNQATVRTRKVTIVRPHRRR